MAPVIGIDLGTKYSCVAVYRHGKVEIIANELDDRTTPSCVAFTNTERLIGDAAKNQTDVNPRNTVFDVKRLIGRYFDDATVRSDMNHWPFDVVSSDGGKPKIQIVYKGENKTLYPEEVSAMVLARMKETAEAYLGKTVRDAVIAVPACFSESQRQATLDAATIAGLNVRQLISEPVAAAIAYGLHKKRDGERNVLIFDLGGGSFDASILTIEDGSFKMRSSSGDTHLGGEDFDNSMVTQLVQEFQRKYWKGLSSDKLALRRLRTACERAKRTLSAATQAFIEVHSLFHGVDFCTTFTRARFEELNADLFGATMEHVQRCLRYAKLEKWEIDDIVLVGGSTRIPRVQELLRDLFDGKELNKSVNLDEAVAYGAAVKAAALNGDMSDLLESDSLPRPIGVADGGLMTPLFERNERFPAIQSYAFTTIAYNQTGAYLHVFEGDSVVTKENNLLGRFEVAGIPPAPPGQPQVEVTFKIDRNGILTASVVDKTTYERRQIPNKRCFTKEEIERLAGEALRYRHEDDQRRQTVDAKNALESYCINLKSTVLEKVDETIKWLDANQQAGKEEFEHKHEELLNVCNDIIKLHGSSRR